MTLDAPRSKRDDGQRKSNGNYRNPMHTRELKMFSWNAAGLKYKIEELIELMTEEDVSITFVSETWLRPDERPHPCICVSVTGPRPERNVTHQHHGLAIVIHPYFYGQRPPFEMMRVQETNAESSTCPSFVTIRTNDGIIVTNLYLSPAMQEHEVLRTIDDIMRDKPSLIMGDWNMRLGAITQDARRCKRGKVTHERLLALGYEMVTEFDGEISSFSSTSGQSNIDLVYAHASILARLMESRIMEDPHLGSDHNPVMASVRLRKGARAHRARSTLRWRTRLLLDEGMREAYIQAGREQVRPYLHSVERSPLLNLEAERRDPPGYASAKAISTGISKMTAQELVDKMEDDLMDLIKLAAQGTIGKCRGIGFKAKDWFMDSELRQMIQARRRTHKDLQEAKRHSARCVTPGVKEKTDNSAAVEATKLLYRRLKVDVYKKRKTLSAQAYRAFTDKLDGKPDGEISKTLRCMARRQKQSPIARQLANDSGMMRTYAAHFERVLTPIIITEPELEHMLLLQQKLNTEGHGLQNRSDKLRQRTLHTEPTPKEQVSLSRQKLLRSCTQDMEIAAKALFNPQKIKRIIMQSAKGKAPGASGLTVEMLQPWLPWVADLLSAMFRAYYQTASIPATWRRANICPIYKKGDPRAIANYRPISLTEITRKIYEKCLHPVVNAYIEPLDMSQNGFRSERNTLDHIATLQHILLQRKELIRPTDDGIILAFLDISTAYDKVDRALLWDKCRDANTNMPEHLINNLKALFENNVSRVIVDGEESEEIGNECGLLQGSILSPILYAKFINDLPALLRSHGVALGINGEKMRMNALLYADDIALIATSIDKMKELLVICEYHSLANNYRFSPTKCEVVLDPAIFRQYRTDRIQEALQLYGQPLKPAAHFSYLGFRFGHNGIDFEGQIARQTQKAISTANMLRSCGFNGNGFGMRTRILIYRTFIRPVMEYGLALVPAQKKYLAKYEQAQSKILSVLYGVGGSTSKVAMQALAGLPSMTHRQKVLDARWTEHLKELPETYYAKGCMQHAKQGYTRGARGKQHSSFSPGNENEVATLRNDALSRLPVNSQINSDTEPPYMEPRRPAKRPRTDGNQIRMIELHNRYQVLSQISDGAHQAEQMHVLEEAWTAATKASKAGWKAAAREVQMKEYERATKSKTMISIVLGKLKLNGTKQHPLLTEQRIPRDEQRDLILYLLGKYPNKPKPCQNCAGKSTSNGGTQPARLTKEHMLRCPGVEKHIRSAYQVTSIEELLTEKDYCWKKTRLASAMLQRAIAACFGRDRNGRDLPGLSQTAPLGQLYLFTQIPAEEPQATNGNHEANEQRCSNANEATQGIRTPEQDERRRRAEQRSHEEQSSSRQSENATRPRRLQQARTMAQKRKAKPIEQPKKRALLFRPP